MNRLHRDIKKRGNISIGIIGSGLMGRGLLAQLKKIEGMDVVFMSSRTLKTLEDSFCEVYEKDRACVTRDLEEAKKGIAQKKTVLTDCNHFVWQIPEIDVVVDCTGNTAAGAEINYYSLKNKKHVVTLNVECDVLLGPLFQKLAEENHVCYTGTAGDEPGSIMELVDFAEFLGFEVLVAGKGKNNPLDRTATPESLKEKAAEKGVSPRMLTSFVDATNTMIELNAVANATGLVPDVVGCHGIKSSRETILEELKLKENGGKLTKYKVLEYVQGIAPGVFVMVHSDVPIIQEEMKYLSMGDGPNYIFYRPYHLTNLETPISIAKAVLYKEATIVPEKGFVAHTVATAKRDIKKGESISGIGSKDTFGQLEVAQDSQKKGHLPIGLIEGECFALNDIPKGSIIKMQDVALDENLLLAKLFTENFGELFHS